MPTIDAHTPGSFCWSELVTSDVDASLVFYGALFDWIPEEADLGDASRYVRCTLKGRPVAAMVQMSQEECDFHTSPYWGSYVQVTDVAAVLGKAESLGGTQVEGPIVVPNAGALGSVHGPDGARLYLWEPNEFAGCGWTREIGAPVWYELLTRQTDASRDFFAGLMGWTPSSREIGEATYSSFFIDGEGKAGLEQMDASYDGIAAQWMLYIAVANINATVEAAAALDAKIVVPPTEIPTVGTVATLRDPQGGLFSIIQMQDLLR